MFASRFAVTRGDIFGGLTAGIVALPLCLAFGVASGLGPTAGLYGGIILGIVASVLGGTAVQISGPTAPMTLVSAGIVAANISPTGEVNLSQIVGVFVLAGAFQVLFGILRLGQYIRFLPYPVVSGLMTGIGIIIVIQQIFPLVGLAAPSSNPVEIVGSLGMLSQGARFDALVLGVATVASLYILPRFIKVIPPSLIALAVLSTLSVLIGLTVPTIGEIPPGLPQFVFPSLDMSDIRPIVVTALQLAFLGSIDALTTSLVADSLTKTHHNSNQELVGQGIGNMSAAVFGGIPGAGAFMRTAINVKAGGRHHSSGVIHGLFLLTVLLGLSSVVQFIPNAVLAGILVGAGLSIIDYRSLAHLSNAPRSDIAIMLLVVLLTIFADLITAVGVGMVIAAFVFMAKVAGISEQTSRLTLASDDAWADEIGLPDDLRKQLVIKHVEGPLFFGFVYAFRSIASQVKEGQVLLLRMERVSYMDQSGIYALQDMLVDLQQANWRICVTGLEQSLIDRLEAMHVIPALLKKEDIFSDFEEFRRALPEIARGIDQEKPLV
ncbi:SulP family inorganic anion transporter [Paracoccus shanxieyensis]|uniref:STAS domain-containing protein n=1 Tax=Paracoccus shanxieyensis TaxID=2675752 RepID=A0A6L6ITJ1_9RHOB|nr:SulP family inorganic anion transporter [Paracoccus shanxieyensis]MTH63835.1 STAS domain-containing protein [Paracoccus shanxieyensis]MTH86653.1 STAS domain-containing protein [Paracoccus shanxieyensis]